MLIQKRTTLSILTGLVFSLGVGSAAPAFAVDSVDVVIHDSHSKTETWVATKAKSAKKKKKKSFKTTRSKSGLKTSASRLTQSTRSTHSTKRSKNIMTIGQAPVPMARTARPRQQAGRADLGMGNQDSPDMIGGAIAPQASRNMQQGATTIPGANSAANVNSLTATVTDPNASPWGLTLVSVFHGPGVTTPGSALQPGSDGYADETKPIYFRETLGVNYKVNPNFIIGPNLMADLRPVMGGKFTLLDPYFKFVVPVAYQLETFKINSETRIYAPASQVSQAANLLTSIREIVTMTYDIPQTKFTLGLQTFIIGKIYTELNNENAPDQGVVVYADPAVVYNFTPNLGLQLDYSALASNNVGSVLHDFNSLGTGITLTLGWAVNPQVVVMPAVLFNTTDVFNLDKAMYGLEVDLSFL